jgi:hypothetical protein
MLSLLYILLLNYYVHHINHSKLWERAPATVSTISIHSSNNKSDDIKANSVPSLNSRVTVVDDSTSSHRSKSAIASQVFRIPNEHAWELGCRILPLGKHAWLMIFGHSAAQLFGPVPDAEEEDHDPSLSSSIPAAPSICTLPKLSRIKYFDDAVETCIHVLDNDPDGRFVMTQFHRWDGSQLAAFHAKGQHHRRPYGVFNYGMLVRVCVMIQIGLVVPYGYGDVIVTMNLMLIG